METFLQHPVRIAVFLPQSMFSGKLVRQQPLDPPGQLVPRLLLVEHPVERGVVLPHNKGVTIQVVSVSFHKVDHRQELLPGDTVISFLFQQSPATIRDNMFMLALALRHRSHMCPT